MRGLLAAHADEARYVKTYVGALLGRGESREA
jgi:hypothetical protein